MTLQEMNAAIAAHWKSRIVGNEEILTPCRCAKCKRLQLAVDNALHAQSDARAMALQIKSQRAVAAEGWPA